MNKILKIIGALLLLALVAAGSFWAGMTYQSNQAEQAQAAFFAARGGEAGDLQFFGGPPTGNRRDLPEGFTPGGNMPGGGGFSGRGTMGQVKSVDGGILLLSTAEDVTTVNLSDSTRIVKSVDGTTIDLEPGTRIMVSGQEGDDGAIEAEQITIIAGMPGGDLPAGPPTDQQP